MEAEKLEERVTAVEVEVALLKRQLRAESQPPVVPWFDKVFGTFKDDLEHKEAMRLGREYRSAQRPDGGRASGAE